MSVHTGRGGSHSIFSTVGDKFFERRDKLRNKECVICTDQVHLDAMGSGGNGALLLNVHTESNFKREALVHATGIDGVHIARRRFEASQ
jgi:hypothetical protein